MAKENNTTAKEVAVVTPVVKEGDIILKDEGGKPDTDAGAYVPPVIDEVGPTPTPEPETPVAPTEPTGPAPGPEVSLEVQGGEAQIEAAPSRVPGPEMVTPAGDVVTNIMLRRIEKHLKYLRGDLGFADIHAQRREQVDFIETIGESTSLPYEKFKVVTDALVRMVADNKDLFRSGQALRFLENLQGHYNQASINRYTDYITFLTKIAVNWTNRSRLRNQTDIAIVIKDLRQAGKENVTMYFNALVAAR